MMSEKQKVRHATEAFRVKLGFSGRDTATIATASATVMRTLEEYGHDTDQFHTHLTQRVEMSCDHYAIDLRHRRSPSPLRDYEGHACKSQLEIILKPHFPDHTDQEITELLVAMILRNLLEDLEDAVAVSWLYEATPVSRADFLSVFDEVEAPILETVPDLSRESEETLVQSPLEAFDAYFGDTVSEDSENALQLVHAEPETNCVQDVKDKRFEPVEHSINDLARHCDDLIASLEPIKIDVEVKQPKAALRLFQRDAVPTRERLIAWASTLLLAAVSVPLAATAATIHIIRHRDMRVGAQLIVMLALVMLIESSNISYAALK